MKLDETIGSNLERRFDALRAAHKLGQRHTSRNTRGLLKMFLRICHVN